jgi:hypothetical protein
VGAAVGVAAFTLGVGAVGNKQIEEALYRPHLGRRREEAFGIADQADKSDCRGQLAGIEDVTGKRAEDTDAMNVKN